jgi:hypothetical protein
VQSGDYVLIQFCHNDVGAIDSLKERAAIRGTADTCHVYKLKSNGKYEVVYSFGWYLRKFIQDVREKGGIPILLSLTPRNIWKGGKIERRNDTYGKWYREVVEQTGVELIDVHNLTADSYDRLGENAKKSGSDAGFYSSLLQTLQAADQSVADVANALPGKNRLVFVRDDPDRVKQAIQNAGMGLGLKEVIAWLDTTKKSLFKTVPGSIFVLHKAFDSTYDYAKHLEYKNIREVQLVKKQLVFRMKNGKTITIDYDDPDGIVRGIVAGYQEKHRD